MLKGILATCRVKISGLEHIEKAKKEGPLIIMLWHNQLAPLAEILLPLSKKFPFSAFISKSRDGEILSQFVLSYKNGFVIRVPHDGRDKALKILIETLQKENSPVALITPDGPRGPRYVLKPGALFAAKEVGAQIISFAWKANRFYAFKTWDAFRLPLPFTTLEAKFSPPLKATEATTLEDLQKMIEEGGFPSSARD